MFGVRRNILRTSRLGGEHGSVTGLRLPDTLSNTLQINVLLLKKFKHFCRISSVDTCLFEFLRCLTKGFAHLNELIGHFHVLPEHLEPLLLEFLLLFMALLANVLGAGHTFIIGQIFPDSLQLGVQFLQQHSFFAVVELLECVVRLIDQVINRFVLLCDGFVGVAVVRNFVEGSPIFGFVGFGVTHEELQRMEDKAQSKFKCQQIQISYNIQKGVKQMADQVPNYESSDEEDRQKVQRTAGNAKNPGYVGANLNGWNDLMLKDELRRALREAGFQHPSEVQSEAIPFAVEGHDVLCQAKSGMGKTAVFVISILNQLKEKEGDYEKHSCIVTCHTRELAHQIHKDFKRLGKYFKKPELRIGCYYGGTNVNDNKKELEDKTNAPHIIIATPGRLLDLVKHKAIKLENCKFFVIDECDQVLGASGMRADVQEVFIKTPHNKQVMMFSATMPEAIRSDCKKFMQNEVEIFVDENKLVLHGLTQYYVLLPEGKKFEKLCLLLDQLTINQIIIFVNRVERATKLTQLLAQKMFNPICIHSRLKNEERIHNYDLFKSNQSKLLVSTDLFGRGMDIERVNVVINYDLPHDRESYLHRVGRAGRFGTKGLAISFIKSDEEEPEPNTHTDKQVLQDIQDGFQIKISELPKEIDTSNLVA